MSYYSAAKDICAIGSYAVATGISVYCMYNSVSDNINRYNTTSDPDLVDPRSRPPGLQHLPPFIKL